MANPTKSHIESAKRVIRYLKGTPNLGTCFHSNTPTTLKSFLKFPIKNHPVAFCDANWGPQDQSVPSPAAPSVTLELFKSRSLSTQDLFTGVQNDKP